MPTLTTQQITDIISYIDGSESFLNTSVKSRFGDLTAFDFGTGLLPVGKITKSAEDLVLTDQRIADLETAKGILKSARDSGTGSGGDCASIVTALNNLANSLNLSNQFNTLLTNINLSLSNLQTAVLNAISAVSVKVDSIQTTVNAINTRTITMNSNINTINTNVTAIQTIVTDIQTKVTATQTTVNLINTRTLTTNSNITTILGWNNAGGILQLIKTCCDNLTTSINLTTVNTKLDTILSWNNTGGVLLGLSSNINSILTWVNTGGILTLIQTKVNSDYDLDTQIKACCDLILSNSSSGNNTDITTIKDCCAALTVSVGNNLSLSNNINTTIQNWISSGGILTLINSTTNQALLCCNSVNTKIDNLNVNVDLSTVTSQLTTIQNTQTIQNNSLTTITNYVDTVETSISNLNTTANNTYETLNTLTSDFGNLENTEFPNLSGNIQIADCDVETFTLLPYSGKGILGLSSQMTQVSSQMNMILKELCTKLDNNTNTISGNIPTIVCSEDKVITETITPFNNITSALTIIGTQITNTRKDLCKTETGDCATLYPTDMFAEFNYESQMSIWFEDSDKSRWLLKVPNPKDFVASDWCTKIHPITISKGNVYGRIFYNNSKVPSSGYFSTEAEAIRVLNLLGNLSKNTFSQPRITKNPQPKRIPKEVTIFPKSVIISTIVDGKVTETKCFKQPIGGCN